MLCLLFIVSFFVSLTSSIPLHASCQLQWSFAATSCDVVRGKLVQQIEKWSGPDNCAQGGEKCLYSLIANAPAEVTATHTTPKKNYVDSLSMKFSATQAYPSFGVEIFEKQPSWDNAGCTVAANSKSNVWYAVLDYGTNYCNLHNLVVGSGLANVTGYSETTSDSVCTEYSSADCSTY